VGWTRIRGNAGHHGTRNIAYCRIPSGLLHVPFSLCIKLLQGWLFSFLVSAGGPTECDLTSFVSSTWVCFYLGLLLNSTGGLWTLHEVSECQIPLPSVAGYHPTSSSSNAFFCGVILGSCPQTLLFPHSRAPHDHRVDPHHLFGSHTRRCAGCWSAKLRT